MIPEGPEDQLLRSVALQNASSILVARERAEEGRREALEALRISEERQRATFHQAAVGMAVTDLSGRFVEMNQKFRDLLGYSELELHDRTFREITHPDDLNDSEERISQLLAGELRDFVMEKRYVREDGETVWGATSVTLLRDAAGSPLRFVAVVQDITERKLFEQALHEESRSLELLNRTGLILSASKLDLTALRQAAIDATTEISAAECGLFHYETWDDDGDRDSCLTIAGVSTRSFGDPQELPLARILEPDLLVNGPVRSDDLLLDLRFVTVEESAASPSPAPSGIRSLLAVPIARGDGRGRGGLYLLHSSPGAFTERSERLVVGIAAQVAIALDNARLYASARKAADERMKLLESERHARSDAERMSSLKDDFLATLSHELRTPLSAILGWAQVLRRGALDAADLSKGLETIERNARLQTRLIEELLDMSRVTSGKLRLDVQQVDLALVVDAAIETVRPAAAAKNIQLQKVLDPGVVPILGDPARLQQVVWNLLSNAIKFTDRDGSVEVSLRRVNSSIEIGVSDTGAGIVADFLPLVFERFRQSDSSTSRIQGGLGLGLAIVKNLVELHGGTVSATSAGPGRGSSFRVLLPLAGSQSLSLGLPTSPPRVPAREPIDFRTISLAGTKVLAVDDEADVRELICRVLSDCSAQVLTAGSAAEALQVIESEHPDVVVSDIGMPEVDGYELLRRVRRLGRSRGGDVPIIALTAFARSEDRTRALQAGFSVHIAKPIEPSELVATVASVSERARVGASSGR